MKKYKNLIDKILDNIEIVTESGCWIWMRGTDDEGYGNISFENGVRKVHRVFFELVNKITLPRNIFVCHKCDVTSCINPNHLFLGTPQDNSTDCVNKGRTYRPAKETCQGQNNYNVFLTDAKVLDIRAKYIPYVLGCKKLAKEYDVTYQLIHKIVTRQIWTHI